MSGAACSGTALASIASAAKKLRSTATWKGIVEEMLNTATRTRSAAWARTIAGVARAESSSVRRGSAAMFPQARAG